MATQTIAVVGATGAQGGGLARAILADPGGPFRVRAITRDTSSEPARTLAAAGAEVVSADLAAYRGFAFPGAEDMGNMFQFKRDFNEEYCAHRDLAKARAVLPGLQDFDTWLTRNVAKIPIA